MQRTKFASGKQESRKPGEGRPDLEARKRKPGRRLAVERNQAEGSPWREREGERINQEARPKARRGGPKARRGEKSGESEFNQEPGERHYAKQTKGDRGPQEHTNHSAGSIGADFFFPI